MFFTSIFANNFIENFVNFKEGLPSIMSKHKTTAQFGYNLNSQLLNLKSCSNSI